MNREYRTGESTTKQYKYEFKLQVQKVYLRIPSQCNVQIWWRRGKGKTTTKNAVKLKGGQSYFKVNQPLAIQGKCILKNGQFESKQSLIQIVIFNYDNTTKLGGSCVVDLTKMISTTNISMNHVQNFELPLENTPDKNGKIYFILSVRFLGECHDQSINDVSFQGNLNQTNDMTFRPNSRDSKQRRTQEQFFKPPESPLTLQRQQVTIPRPNQVTTPKIGERPMQFSFNPTVKIDPQRDRQSKAQMQMISQLRQQINDKNKEIQTLKSRIKRMQQNQRKSYTLTNQKSLQLMNELNVANTKVQEYKVKVKDIEKQLQLIERQNDDIRGEKIQLRKQLQKINEELGEYRQKVTLYEKDLPQLKSSQQEVIQKLSLLTIQRDNLKQELFRKQSQQITLENTFEQQLATIKQKNNRDLIEISEEIKQLKTKIDELYAENLILKKENSQNSKKAFDVSKQSQDLKKALNQRTQQLQKFNSEYHRRQEQLEGIKKNSKLIIQQKEQVIEQLTIKFQQCEQKLTQSQQSYSLLEQRFRQKQQLLQQIEFQFHHLQSSNDNQNNLQLTQMKEKLTQSMKRIQDMSKNQQSLNIMLSEQKVKVKNLESACDNLQRQMDEKDEIITQKDSIIEKAKAYIKDKQKQIEQRDEFITNAKNYLQERERQFNEQRIKFNQYISNNQSQSNKQTQQLKKKINQLTYQLQSLQIALTDKENQFKDKQSQIRQKQLLIREKDSQLSKTQKYLQQCSMDMNEKIQRIQDLQHYIQSLQQRIQITQQQLQQVNRKNKALNQTFEEIVRKNFDMEIQLNIKKAQLDAVRSYR